MQVRVLSGLLQSASNMSETNVNQGRILYWQGKHGPWFCYARTEEEKLAAYMKLFKFMNEYGFYKYCMDDLQRDLHKAARYGDKEAAADLIDLRSSLGYEYEHVSLEEITDPLNDQF